MGTTIETEGLVHHFIRPTVISPAVLAFFWIGSGLIPFCIPDFTAVETSRANEASTASLMMHLGV